MSNQAVGNVYQTIIDEVINSSRVDFEENGVDEAVLEELRLGWQRKLTQLDVAAFPWDPKPETPASRTATGTGAAPTPPAAHTQAQLEPTLALPGAQAGSNGIKQEPDIKQEPGIKTEPGQVPLPSFNGMDDKNSIAAQRAAQQLQAQYGNRAAGSINAIRDGMSQQPNPAQQTAVPQPGGNQGPQPPAYDGMNNISNGQTDGAGDDADFEGVILRRSADGQVQELGRLDIDRMIHNQIAANSKAMEGGGLMVPLKEIGRQPIIGSSSRARKGKGVAQHDGGGDEDEDDEFDEDAINSDLDDSEGDDPEDVDDDELGNIMLCTYDKVQRVKNKWKCILKDGVLTVNGKEYVFHKATGEFEW